MKSVSALGIVISFIASHVVSVLQGQPSAQQAERFFTMAEKEYEAGKYQLAAGNFEKALHHFSELNSVPGQIKSFNLLGECLANLNQCDKAIQVISQSLSLAKAKLAPNAVEIADTYYYLSRATGGCARQHDEAVQLMRTSIDRKRKIYGGEAKLAPSYTFLGYIFENKGQSDSALYYLQKALNLYGSDTSLNDLEISHTFYNLGKNYENRSELKKALEFYQKSFNLRKNILDSTHVTISNSLHQMGSVYHRLGNFDRARDFFEQALAIRIKSLGVNHANVASSYLTIGNLYGTMFNYVQATDYIKRGSTILESIYGDKNDVVPTYDAYLGRMYGKLGDHEAALQYLRKAQARAEKILKPDQPNLAVVYNSIGDYYLDTHDLSKSSEYFRMALTIYRKAHGPNSAREADILMKIGSINSKSSKFNEARTFFAGALAIYRSKMGHQNPKVASAYQFMAEDEAVQGLFEKSLRNYQRAFSALSTNFDDTINLFSNPVPEQVYSKPMALKIAVSKARLLTRLSEENKDISALRHAFRTYQLAIALMQDIALGYDFDKAKAELEKESREIYNHSMNLAYQLYQKTGEITFIQDAFAISEKSKSVQLLENIRDFRAKSQAGVPDSLVEKERDSKVELAYCQSALREAVKNKDNDKISAREKELFETQQKYGQLKSKLEKQFPAYFNLKYNTHQLLPDDVQRLLPNNSTALVEFYMGDSALYKFTISRKVVAFEKIKNNEALERLMNDYEKSLGNADFVLNAKTEADQLYASTAFALYEKLLKSTFERHGSPLEKLIVIPDDRLGQFNFGTLLSKEVSGKNPDYKHLEYVARHTQINYAYSSLLLEKGIYSRKDAKEIFGGFAPLYSDRQFMNMDTLAHPMTHLVVRSGHLPLPGAIEEVKLISRLMKGDLWIEHEATETNFKTKAGKYAILHLAMHSLLNNESPDNSELLFSEEQDDQNDGYLSVSEIYNLKLNASMVVLSACSSGFGTVQVGEGPISISRAFSYAGCPSVVMSLWKIPDAVTSQIMTRFYRELENGKQKDEALRIAQLAFLNETEDPLYHHPYFWAGLVVMGDSQQLPKNFPWWTVIVGIVVAATVLFLFFQRNRMNSI
jgi:CHAT domain-containing protein/Flp pilus assembly protein TadD